jgi:hypothetical protein
LIKPLNDVHHKSIVRSAGDTVNTDVISLSFDGGVTSFGQQRTLGEVQITIGESP